MRELCRLRRSEGYGVRDDEASHARGSRCTRHGRHVLRIDLLRPPAFSRGLFPPPRPAGQEKAPETLVSGGLLDAWRFAYAAASAAAGIS